MNKKVKIVFITINVILVLIFTYKGVFSYKAYKSLAESIEVPELIYSYKLSDTQKNMEITLQKGDAYAAVVSQGFLEFVTTPLMAIWIEDENNNHIKTLYVSSKLFEIDRPAALPVWQHKSSTYKADDLDGISSASNINHQGLIETTMPDKFSVFIEVNRSFDYNEYYHSDLEVGTDGYNTDYNGQPSLIYKATIIDLNQTTSLEFELIGHGSADGSNGKIMEDLTNITTAKNIIKSLSLQIKK